MLFLYEIKKIIKNKNFIMLLILFVVIDIACIFAKCSNYISDTDKTYYKELKITNEYEGILTSEKVDSITENYERLSRIISYGYSTDYDENTYTGYQMLDYYVYSSLNDELSRIYNFQNDIAEKTNSIKLKAEFFARNGNYTLSKQYTKTADNISERNIYELHNYTGVSEALNYNISAIFMVMLSVFICSISFSKDSEIAVIILSASYGRKYAIWAKIFASIAYVVLIVLLFTIIDFSFFASILELHGMSAPLYFLNGYELTGFQGNIIQFIFLKTLSKIIYVLLVSSVCIFISTLLGKSSISIFLSLVLSIVPFLFVISGFNPADLIEIENDFVYPSYIGIIQSGYVKITVWLFACLIIIGIALTLYRRKICRC